MNLHEILELIKKEKETSSRFPVRVIYANTLTQYNQLVENLRPLCDRVIGLAEYCESNDTFPRIDRLKNDLIECTSKCILVLSISEYLRIGFRRELPGTYPQFSGIFNMQQDSSLNKKVFIPLFACEQIFEQIVIKVDPRRIEHVWHVQSMAKEEQVNFTVYSKVFENVIEKDRVVIGMREWLKMWDEGINSLNYSLVTKLAKHADDTHGICAITKVIDLFQYVVDSLKDGNMLRKEWGSEVNWKYISTLIKNRRYKTTTEIICEGLNMAKFDAFSVLATWGNIDGNRKWLFWLWYKLNTSNDYISYAVTNAKEYINIPKQIRDAVLSMPLHDEQKWLIERKKALDVLKINENYDEYFNKLNLIPDQKRRLQLLCCNSQEERVFTIKTISQMLKQGESVENITNLIQDKYEIMAQYLQPEWTFDYEQLNKYFNLYRKYKLINKYSDVFNMALDKTSMILNNIDTRYAIIKKYASQNDDVFIIWVDGLGAEWASLILSQLLVLEPNLIYDIAIGRAILPTETETNNQWSTMGYPYIKLDRFDKLAHRGIVDDQDYFSCIEKQLEYINEFAREAISRLSNYGKVIITADHGTSRIAALAFHALIGINPPEDSIPRSFGRYCEINREIKQSDIHPSAQRFNNYLVFRTHEHYKSSGNAAGASHGDIALPGEIHGGMTPEEVLVPVIAISKNSNLSFKKLSFKIESNQIKPDRDNMVKLVIYFNYRVKNLKVVSLSQEARCYSQDGLKWEVAFDNFPFGDHLLDIYADNKLLDNQEVITVKTRGIIIDDDF